MPKRKRTKKRIALYSILFLLLLSSIGAKLLWPRYESLMCLVSMNYPFTIAVGMYSHEDEDGKYPPMSSVPGRLFIDFDSVYPDYVSEESSPYFCDAMSREYKKRSLEEKFKDPTYLYTGYVLETEEQLIAFLSEYPSFLEGNVDFNEDLPAPEGKGSFGGDTFIRITDKIDREKSDSKIILFIEIPTYTMEGMEFRHGKIGGYIKYLSGPAGLVRSEENDAITPAVLQRIGEIKRRNP